MSVRIIMNRKTFTLLVGTYIVARTNYLVRSTEDGSLDTSSLNTDGWIPNSFPDPLHDQNACRISNITSLESCNSLLLCDPDNVISQNDLQSIATSLYDFNAHNSRNNSCPLHLNRRVQSTNMNHKQDLVSLQPQIGLAIVQKMDVRHIIHDFEYVYTFEDEDDLVNDSAQYFASFLHNSWFSRNTTDDATPITDHTNPCYGSDDIEKCRIMNRVSNGIIIFISIDDEACFISIGSSLIHVLTWWRMESVILQVKDGLRQPDTFDAVIMTINHIQYMMNEGPPSTSEKVLDFLYRFGVFILFAFTTFTMTLVANRLERRKYFRDADQLSKMDAIETEKAKILQQGFKTRACPICLEPFLDGIDMDEKSSLNYVDSYGIPMEGSDGMKLKILRCGHIIDRTCWITWISTGKGDIMRCPVCRQGVAKDIQSDYSDYSFHTDLRRSRRRLYGATRAEEVMSSVSDERESQEERLLNASFFLS